MHIQVSFIVFSYTFLQIFFFFLILFLSSDFVAFFHFILFYSSVSFSFPFFHEKNQRGNVERQIWNSHTLFSHNISLTPRIISIVELIASHTATSPSISTAIAAAWAITTISTARSLIVEWCILVGILQQIECIV